MCPSGCQAVATGTMAIKGATGCPRRSQFCSQRGRVHVHLDVEWPSPQCRPRRCGAARWTEESLKVWAVEESPTRGELATPCRRAHWDFNRVRALDWPTAPKHNTIDYPTSINDVNRHFGKRKNKKTKQENNIKSLIKICKYWKFSTVTVVYPSYC